MDNKTPVVALNVQYIKDLSLEIPQLLFPYARQIISSNLAEAGLPPLLLSPLSLCSA